MFFKRKNVRISIRNKNLVVETKSGINLYNFLLSEKLITHTLCNGSGQCGKCKVRVTGANAPEPASKEKLILAKVQLESGYRLACMHSVKKDIEIDISEMPINMFAQPVSVPKPKVEESSIIEEVALDVNDDDVSIVDEELMDDKISINEFKPIAEGSAPHDNHDDEGSSDGVFLVQQRNGVRYFCYSAALDNIVSEGVSETSEPLRDVIDNNLISDFIHDVLKIKDIDRVLLLIEQSDYKTIPLLDMIRYFKFHVGTLLCEVIMPHTYNHDVIRFFRLLNADKSRKLMFSLDMLDRVTFLSEKLVTDMSYDGLDESNMLSISCRKKNAILDFNDDFTPKNIEKKGVPPDSMTLPAFLKAIKLMRSTGIINNNFIIRKREDLIKSKVSLDLTVRITGKDENIAFYIFRDKFNEILITQKDLDMIFQIKNFIISTIEFTEKKIERISGLVFYTSTYQEHLIDYMLDLGIIPDTFASKIVYQNGEATVQAIKLFKEKNIPTYIDNYFDNVRKINLDEEELFSH